MNTYRVVDEHGDKYTYKASGLRAVLVIHHQLYGTEIVRAERVDD